MKKVILCLMLAVFSLSVWAGVPEGISYQTVVRDANGELVKDKTISIRISILEGVDDKEVVYEEDHSVSTNVNGLASLCIGHGDSDDDFEDINWAVDGIFVKSEVDVEGGSDFKLTCTTQLLSVPYAIHSKEAESIAGDDLKLEYETLSMGDEDEPNIYVNDDNQMLFFTKDSDPTRPDLRKDIQLAPDVRMWGYSSEYHLDRSGVLNLQAVDSASKPAIVWYNPEGERRAAIVGHEYSGGHDNRHNHWSIETTNEIGELHTRMEFPFDSSVICIETHSADFKIGGKNKFIATGPVYCYNTGKVGFGDKEWEEEGLEGSAKWEMYRGSTTAKLLLHQASGEKSAVLGLKRDDTEWELSNAGNFTIEHDNDERLTITPDGKVGIGEDNPEYQLDVDGNVNVSSGHSYLTDGADYAEFFLCKGELAIGDVVGINLRNGLAGKYKRGYELIGIVSDNAGFVGNNASGRIDDPEYVLVGLQGQLAVDETQVEVKKGRVYTLDEKQLGIMLANGKVFIKIRD